MWTVLLTVVIAAEPLVSGDAVIRARAGSSEIVINTTSRVAGAIHSLTWNGKEFLDSADHGRQMQSAANFDADGPFVAEVYNPTEAGSLFDGAGPTSTSRLASLHADGHRLATVSQMAFWLRPGERSAGHPAGNTAALSNHWFVKRVEIGATGRPHVIGYHATFIVPEGERHTFGQFEAVTGYMPAEFSTFWKFDPQSGRLDPLDDGPGEQTWPVVLATLSGSHAMGVFSPAQPSRGFEAAGYGRFRFVRERVTKWNCVFRVKNPNGIATGAYTFPCFVIVGTKNDVERNLRELMADAARSPQN